MKVIKAHAWIDHVACQHKAQQKKIFLRFDLKPYLLEALSCLAVQSSLELG